MLILGVSGATLLADGFRLPDQDAFATANVPLTPALLRLDPMFDPLRNDPRFQQLLAEKEQIGLTGKGR